VNATAGRIAKLNLAGALALALSHAGGCRPVGNPRLYTYPPSAAEPKREPRPEDPVRLLSPRQALDELQTKPDVFLLCVSGKEDYDRGHIRGSVLIPAPGLPHALKKNIYYPEINRGRIPRKDQPIIVYCWWKSCYCPSVPTFSDVASKTLLREGYTDVGKIDGGMRSWREARLPIEKAPKAPAHR